MRLEADLRIAAPEQRIEEPGIASGAPLRGRATVAVRIGGGGDLVHVDGDADPRVLDDRADGGSRGGVGTQLVVCDAQGGRPVAHARGVDAVGVAEEGEHGRLVEGHPVGDPIVQP